jgi:hypothetical protein
MKFTAFLHKKLIDLLNDRRIVVWYDAEGDFKAFAGSFNAPNCELLSSGESVLKTRRRADEVYRLMNESDNPAESGRCLLIYVPGRRGATGYRPSRRSGKIAEPAAHKTGFQYNKRSGRDRPGVVRPGQGKSRG